MPRSPRFRQLPATLLAGLALVAPPESRAVTWSFYTSPLANYGAVTAGAGSYRAPSACSDGRGGMWVACVDDLSSSDTEITLRRVASDGTGDFLRTLTGDSFDQDQPQVVASDSGGVFVVWRDARNAATTGYDIYVQYVGPEGLVRWAANGVQVTNAAGTQETPFVGRGSSGLAIAWLDDRNGAANTDIYFGRVSHAGVVSNLAGSIVTNNATDQVELSGTPYEDGLLVVWRDIRNGNWDIYGQKLSASGFTDWDAYGNSSICTAAGTQSSPRVVSDGQGGGYVVWEDLRGADLDIYAQHVERYGQLQYGLGGVPVCTAASNQIEPRLDSDGNGGYIVTWLDDRAAPRSLYAQRMVPSGVGLWTANGVDVASGIVATPTDHSLVSDGIGGAFVAWSEARANGADLYGQRLSATGSVQWSTSGALISGAYGGQTKATVTTGSENSLLAAWEDERQNVGDPSIYAQRVDRYGYLGDAAPKLVDVSDVLGDQGGQVRIDWTPGYVEFDPYLQVNVYYVLRQVPAALANRLTRAGARLVHEPTEPARGERVILAQPSGTAVTYWEYVGQSPAFQSDTYSFIAPTTSDSVVGVPASTQFMLQARNASGSRYWFSNVKVGHSLDNLAPLAPAPFAGTYASGSARLTWNPNREPDLAGYRLHRGTTAGFTPGPGSLVAALSDTGYVDAAGAPHWYKLIAVDVHGNESPVATALPAGTTTVEPGTGTRAFFAIASANPARAGGTTTLRFGLATAGRASLALYDATGRRVRALAGGAYEPGEHAIDWDGRDEAGRAAPPGLYFARFETVGYAATRKLVVQD